ncbi:MAG: DEAD/DEAH box helicase family protein [Armatimonadetes bacterium]|nr:DEAD/DEAH box helicase family protein [Armatimonadota bacterium]
MADALTTPLYHRLNELATQWEDDGFPCEYSTVAEIIQWARLPELGSFRLRAPQLRALVIYWYLRLVKSTPHVVELYRELLPRKADLVKALGVSSEAFERADYDIDALFDHVKNDDPFTSKFHLEALRESLALAYPSYVLALAMGAGKTALIGAISATEFAMSLDYPDGPFVQNALVFAPGKTIIESLRQLAQVPYQCILPPRLYKPFAASVKLTFTRDGEKDIPVIRGSSFNVVVTNTEKIRIQKQTIRSRNLSQMQLIEREKQEQEIANLRLQAIASLPHLAVFSDEAHHTYGQALASELKKVRKTVDYLHENSPNLICVVNTTGTPYYQRQLLRDVVVWYGLSEGIRDGILKEVAGSIQAFSFDDNVEAYVAHVVGDFFADYGNVTLPDGTPAKLAMYFPQTDDVRALRSAIESKLAELGLSPTIILEHHTRNDNKADFDRFKFKDSPHRIALLVDRGVEGWDVPALFACALARRLHSSNNFVLQAACRCLRQVPGNTAKARIYLSMDNRSILDRQLQETYGETIADLNSSESRSLRTTIRLEKLNIPPLVVKQVVRTVVRREADDRELRLAKPEDTGQAAIKKYTYTVAEQKATYEVLRQVGDSVEIMAEPDVLGLYSAASELASVYRLDYWVLYDELCRVYAGAKDIPKAHLAELAAQIENQMRNYEVREEVTEVALALVRKEGFDKSTGEDGAECYTAEISYPVDRARLLASWDAWKDKAKTFGFHYDPYNFDSSPEMSFFEQLLEHINVHPAEIEDIYFTGALTSSGKTDFYIEYRALDDTWHTYTPDFLIRRKDGRCYIVEVKREHDRTHAIDGEGGRKDLAIQKWVGLNPDKLKYELIFVKGDAVAHDETKDCREFVEEA